MGRCVVTNSHKRHRRQRKQWFENGPPPVCELKALCWVYELISAKVPGIGFFIDTHWAQKVVKPSIMIALFITLLFLMLASDYVLRRWTRKEASPYPAQVYLQGKVAVRNVMLPRFMWARRRIDAAPTFI